MFVCRALLLARHLLGLEAKVEAFCAMATCAEEGFVHVLFQAELPDLSLWRRLEKAIWVSRAYDRLVLQDAHDMYNTSAIS
jgi:hypothetical protein